MWKKSLKARLTLSIGVPVITAFLVVGAIGFYSAKMQAEGLYDTELSHVANLMLSLLKAEDEEEATHVVKDDDEDKPNPDIIELGTDFENSSRPRKNDIAFRIWKDGHLIFRSIKAADFGIERVASGFSNDDVDGKTWRFYSLVDAKSGYTLEVAQNLKGRIVLINRTLGSIFFPLILLMPIIVILTWIGMRTGLRPLISISNAVRHRSSQDLTPLSTDQSLAEITPLIASINGLLINLKHGLEKERRFTDFAAHELRTPVAIFKTQAQTALRAVDDAERTPILEAQVEAANRAARVVDQLLTLARLEHTEVPAETFSLTGVSEVLIRERLSFAQKKDISLSLEHSGSVDVCLNKELLIVILSNLIDNAIKYSPNAGVITVSIVAEGSNVSLIVSDTGKGVAEDKLPHITERFYRAGSHSEPGAGLGLSIVTRAAEIMGLRLTLRNRDAASGFEAKITIPSAAA